MYFWILEPATNSTIVNPNGIKTPLAIDASTIFINGNPAIIDSPKSLTRSPPHFIILECRVFDNFILADKSFSIFLRKVFYQLLATDVEN